MRYAAADVAVFLSDYEGFGLPALEAAARGLRSSWPIAPRCARSSARRPCWSTRATRAASRTRSRASCATPTCGRDLVARGRGPGGALLLDETARRTREVLAAAAGRRERPTAHDGPRRRRRRRHRLLQHPRGPARVAWRSLAEHVALPLEVVVVDNASADGSAAAARAALPTPA